jgi:two-component system phosphate regulon sensor histidine kinase PhoR
VEVLANALNTILRSRFYSDTGDWAAFFWAAFIAAITLFALDRAQGRPEFARQAGALAVVGVLTAMAAYFEFAHFSVFPPVVPGLVSFASAGILGLLWRNLAASSRLDESIATLSESSDILVAAPGETAPRDRTWLPKGLEWKARKIGELNARIVDRAKFVDQALRSVDDGLIMATPQGIITFANPRSGAILQAPRQALVGQNLIERLHLNGDILHRLVVDRGRVEREIEIPGHRSSRYILRMAPVVSSAGTVTGIVASLSDVTRHYQLQQTKNDVIALVSHEMRTPLTAIQGMTELLANYEMDAARRKELSSAINSEVKRLTGLITGYLDITRLESGATPLRKTPVKVEVLLQRIVLLLEPVAAQRNIRLELKPSRMVPAIFADADLLGRALENLVSNAIKYSPQGTKILIEASAAQDAVVIAVTDQGYGIPEADLARIFEKFYRVPRVEDADVPGTGLGLALVRDIAELHGGTVTVTSKVHQGSTFTLRIPQREGADSNSTLEK